MNNKDIKYLKHTEINKKKWDNCLKKSINGIVYGYSFYLDIVSPNWDALVYKDYEIVMPLTWKKKYGITYLAQPFFTQQTGIFSMGLINEEIINSFISKISRIYKYVDINLNSYNPIKEFQNVKVTKRDTYRIDLIPGYPTLQSKYTVNTKRNIKKAQKNKIFVNKGVRPNELIDLFKEDKKQAAKQLNEGDFNKLRMLISFARRNSIGEILGVYSNKNQLLTAAFFIKSNNIPIYLFAASSKEGKEQRASFLLIDEYIKHNSEQELILDFEGSDIPGLARFYSSFGAKKINYYHIKINNLPPLIKWLKK